MECREVQEGLSRFLDVEMAEGEREAVRAHCEACRSCRDLLAAHEAVARALASVPEASWRPSGDVPSHRDVMRQPQGRPRGPWSAHARAVLVSAAVLALVALTFVLRGVPEPVATPPTPSVASAGPRDRSVRLGEATFHVSVEGESTRLLSCRVSEGGGATVEVDCTEPVGTTP